MTLFWLIVALLLVAATALFILPMLKGPNKKADADRDALNKAFYQQRLNELEVDEALGVISERDVMVAELQHNLLEDIPAKKDTRQSGRVSRAALLPGVVLLCVVSIGLYMHTGAMTQVSQWQQVMTSMPEMRKKADAGLLNEPEDIARFALGLRTELLTDPTNVSDWAMLGLAGLRLGNGEIALRSYEKAYELSPNDGYIQIIYAKLLTRSNNPDDIVEATRILKALLKTDPENTEALSALAMSAFGQGNFHEAIAAWEKLLTLMPADAKGIDVIRQSLTYAKSQVASSGVRLGVTLSISPEVASQMPKNGSVLITVTDGESTVPVVVKQVSAGEFPMRVELDDGSAMMPSRLLSSLKQVKITATITSSDKMDKLRMTGESRVYPFTGQETVDVTIEKIEQ